MSNQDIITTSAPIVEVNQAEMLEAINRSEVDIQIATAKKYPRDIKRALTNIQTIATLDQETAMDCFYVLKRGENRIEGLSVRLAEIIASQWGNLRVQTRIIGNDGKTITAQGVCLDLETNLGVLVETKRRITDRTGRTYSEDMQVMTGNAASAIAFRNAVLKVVPKAVTSSVIKAVKEVAVGKGLDMTTRRRNLIAFYGRLGISREQILAYCGVSSVEEIDGEMLYELAGVKNSIHEGTTTAQEVFGTGTGEKSKKMAEEARKKAEEKKARVEAAMAKAKAPKKGDWAEKAPEAPEPPETPETPETEAPTAPEETAEEETITDSKSKKEATQEK